MRGWDVEGIRSIKGFGLGRCRIDLKQVNRTRSESSRTAQMTRNIDNSISDVRLVNVQRFISCHSLFDIHINISA